MTRIPRDARVCPPLMQTRRMRESDPPKWQSQGASSKLQDKTNAVLTTKTQRKRRNTKRLNLRGAEKAESFNTEAQWLKDTEGEDIGRPIDSFACVISLAEVQT